MSASDTAARGVGSHGGVLDQSSSADLPGQSMSLNLEPLLNSLQQHSSIHSNNANNINAGLGGGADSAAPGTPAGVNIAANQQAKDFLKMILPSVPFLLLLALKFLFDHKVGLLLFAILFIVFVKCNELVVRLIGNSRSAAASCSATQSSERLTMISVRCQAGCLCLLCAACVALVLYIFSEQSLWLCLLCLPPTLPSFGFWSLLFTVTVTDMLLKFIAMSVKLAFLCLLTNSLSCVTLARMYIITERFYVVYRQFVPIGVWYATLLSGAGSESLSIYTILLVIAYGIFKVHSLYVSALPQLWLLIDLIQSPYLFATSSGRSIAAARQNEITDCPICQEAVRDVVRLPCQHAFCLGCLLRWLSQSRTCPMCRQAVATPMPGSQDALACLDGSTSSGIQIY